MRGRCCWVVKRLWCLNRRQEALVRMHVIDLDLADDQVARLDRFAKAHYRSHLVKNACHAGSICGPLAWWPSAVETNVARSGTPSNL